MGKRVLIVGAGISGLSAGCYARMNGYDVEIHESHDKPGGLCTAWKRGEYTIDGCVEWLTGSRPTSPFHPIWQELGAVQNAEFLYHDIAITTVDRDGRAVNFYADTYRLEEHLIELSPADSSEIRKLCRATRKLDGLQMPMGKPAELEGWWDGVRSALQMAPLMPTLASSAKLTLAELGARFQNPSIGKAIAESLGESTDPALALYMVLGSVKDAGYPMGGSLPFARSIEKRLLGLGGEIRYRSRVAEVLERDGRAIGVRLADGEEIGADCVIAACDMRATLFSMLGGKHVDPRHQNLLDTGKIYAPYVQVSFGVDMDFSDETRCIGTAFELDEPTDLAGKVRTHIVVRNMSHDPASAPPGKSVVCAMMPSDWAYWEPFANDRSAYKAEKQRLSEYCLDRLDQWYPGFSSKVEMTDVATPLTFERYTGNWQGAYMTWILDMDSMREMRDIPRQVPDLEDFYLSSMWTSPPGGLPGAAIAGREVIQLLCAADDRKFETSNP